MMMMIIIMITIVMVVMIVMMVMIYTCTYTSLPHLVAVVPHNDSPSDPAGSHSVISLF
jgi:hypothetical protein